MNLHLGYQILCQIIVFISYSIFIDYIFYISIFWEIDIVGIDCLFELFKNCELSKMIRNKSINELWKLTLKQRQWWFKCNGIINGVLNNFFSINYIYKN